MSLSIIILAAGQGKRMRSRIPKVLHKLAGRTLLEHVYVSALQLNFREAHIVYGYGGRQVPEALAHLQAVNWVEQQKQLGTGHAVRQAITHIPGVDDVLILYGDVPLITYQTLQRLVDAADETGFSLLTSYIDDPKGYGRIIRDGKGDILRIVEEKDTGDEERSVCEINTGMMTVKAKYLSRWLEELDNNNRQGEFYLTDIVQKAVSEGITISTTQPDAVSEIRGINDRVQLAEMERYYQLIQAHHLMRQGVTLMDPGRFDLRGELEAGRDINIDVNVVLEGSNSIGDNVAIGANCQIKDVDIADGVVILPNCVIENAVIGERCRIGPFARIRPGTRLAKDVHVGNFVEVKNTEVASGSKMNHLSYIGDAEIGKDTNIGAGTITCNYDGANKHKTIIGNDVHIGSDTQLIAPVKIGNGVTIGAGTTVTRDIEPNRLVHNKVEHREVKGWKRPKKKQD
ncbi:MAG: UDP-N-acetylglucosamine diphosphorylase/glucosamine-1-phosphate N-acetyltransferase [Gammaproteobacteria bacterium RIFCSPLOWO2_12_FULL_52_10]|nr:MAG: UDP-N-acetylglucosamine diphosphorylase/glucosamine-1-phosphate N-acetyltransferase [Gammaproteobacteria bacterium RIFCSPLOWO2_12_FULL_52_10]